MLFKISPENKKRLQKIKVFAIDLDGTIYLGNNLFPFSLDFLNGLKSTKKDIIFLTNNSSKNANDYKNKLSNMGIEVTLNQIYTANMATIEYLNKKKPSAKIFLMGTKNLQKDFLNAGFILDDQNPDFVVLGFDLTFTYEKFEQGCYFIRNGVPFIATHPDFNCPIENGNLMPDCGSLTVAFTAATGVKPKVMGKPNKEMLDGLLNFVNIKREELCLIGDRLMTDTKMGFDFNILNILVLTGETKPEHLQTSDVQPDIILEKNIDLLKYL
jgi:HAD superfamily hydrolase (TIGR01457 family)